MAKTFEIERAELAKAEAALAEKKRGLAAREKDEVAGLLGKSALVKVGYDRAKALIDRMSELGVDEVEKRLAK